MYCGSCGKEIENSAKFCPACGRQVVRKQVSTISQASATYNAPIWILGIFFLIGLLLAAFIPNYINNIWYSTLSGTEYRVSSFYINALNTAILLSFSAMGVAVYSSCCEGKHHKEAVLSLWYAVFPFGIRTIISAVQSVAQGVLYSMIYKGNLSLIQYSTITDVLSVITCILTACVSLLALSHIVGLKSNTSNNSASGIMNPDNSVQVHEYEEHVSTFEISEKGKGATALLCFFFGGLGIHRFYVGKVGTGLLWMFTGGLFGIGWIADFFVILFGGFKDSFGKSIK